MDRRTIGTPLWRGSRYREVAVSGGGNGNEIMHDSLMSCHELISSCFQVINKDVTKLAIFIN